MTVRLRIAGHPLHPLFVHFPVALWCASVLWDIIGFWRTDPLWWEISFWCLALGLIIALPALITGFFEYIVLQPGHPAMSIATAHMLLMLTSSICFVLSLVARTTSETSDAALSLAAVAFSGVGVILLLIGGWLGGSLVYRHGIGRLD